MARRQNPQQSNSQSLANDLYGNFYYYLLEVLDKFSGHLNSSVPITLTCADARDLATILPKVTDCQTSFDFIDVSNVTDWNNMGLDVLSDIGQPLLKPEGVLQGLFFSYPRWGNTLAFPSAAQLKLEQGDTVKRVVEYITALWNFRAKKPITFRVYNSINTRNSLWGNQLTEWQHLWEDYRKIIGLDEVTKEDCFEIKRFVRPWVLRKACLRNASAMVQAALKLEELVLGDIWGADVYVQWVKKGCPGKRCSKLEDIAV